ncbi:MAG: GNAT family N-acetyltransferase [Anaerolineae bacterium]|nr:GNAT family N-acetyltransferase [Anaerolineae bacterium]
MIKGNRVTLRAIERDDIPRYVTWLNDPEVTHHLALFLPMNLDDETDWYEAQRKDQTTQNFALVVNEGNVHIGSVGLMHLNYREQNAELGIVLGDKTQWGKGYGREAIQLLLDFAFAELNLHRVYLRVDAGNARAIRCYRACHFVEEGRLRDAVYHRGCFEDQLIMSVLRSEYLK